MIKEIRPENAKLTILFRDRERTFKLDGCDPFIAISEDYIDIPYGPDERVEITKKACRVIFQQRGTLYDQLGDLDDFSKIIGARITGDYEKSSGDGERKTFFMIPHLLEIGMEWNFEIDDIDTIKWLMKL